MAALFESLPHLNQTDRAITRYVMDNLDTIPFMSIRDLSVAIPVSQTSIWRYCKKLGCDGYTDFKWKIREYQGRKKESLSESRSIDESVLINFLQRAGEPLIRDKIEEAAGILAGKELVIFLGEGSSGRVAEYGATFFSSLFALSLTQPHLLNNPPGSLTSSSGKSICGIALSVTGETDKVIANVQYLREIGASVISITNSEGSTLARLSDVNISYYIALETNLTANVTSQVPAVFIIEKLGKRAAQILAADKGDNIAAS